MEVYETTILRSLHKLIIVFASYFVRSALGRRRPWAPPGRERGGHLTPLDFASRIITVAPRVEIQMHFWKGAKFAGSVGHPMTKMLSASGGLHPLGQGLCPWTPLGALPPDPRYRLMLPTRHGVPQPLTPSAAYDPLEKILWAPLTTTSQFLHSIWILDGAGRSGCHQ